MTASKMCSYSDELTDPLYRSEGFMMFCYKILPCKKSFRHDWRVCPFAHGDETAKRRDPRIYKYTGVICPDAKKGRSCPRADDCPCTHSLFEYWLHPTRFKTEICSRGSRCNRPFCFFAHKQSEIRKPNFRVQMQGITCDPSHHYSPLHSDLSPQLTSNQFMQSGSRTNGRAQHLDPTAARLLSSAALSSLSLEGSSISVPDSGSSCDVELPTATWSSWLGSDSPPAETGRQQHLTGPPLSIAQATSAPYFPVFPQIPTSEHNAVDWSLWLPPSAKRQGSTTLSSSLGQDWKMGRTIGMSPRQLDQTYNAAKSLKESASTTTDNGYDRNYLLATIRDVYQSMLSGCSTEQKHSMTTMVTSTEGAQPYQHRASFGLTGGGSYGTCGLVGLQQQNGCVSSNYTPDPFESLMCALLKTESNSPAAHCFK